MAETLAVMTPLQTRGGKQKHKWFIPQTNRLFLRCHPRSYSHSMRLATPPGKDVLARPDAHQAMLLVMKMERVNIGEGSGPARWRGVQGRTHPHSFAALTEREETTDRELQD